VATAEYNTAMTRSLFTTSTLLLLLVPMLGLTHNVSESNASFVETINGPAVLPFLYLGAKHMTTGYDHLLYLIGVVFFLYRARDVLLYVTLFTIGHSITLLAGVLGELTVNAFVINAIIGLSIVYKAFENMGGFERVLGFRPDMRAAVLVFGLCHGLGLATKLQALALSDEGLITNMLSFNVGVELGQVLALVFVLLILVRWRSHQSFQRHAFATNTALMTGGFVLAGYQIVGYMVTPCC
jgi:hypothetical protein